MELLKTYDVEDSEKGVYKDRQTVRCIILDKEKNQVLLFGDYLVGGEVEAGESDEEAIDREALEEIGAELEVLTPVGEIIAYREAKKVKYIVRGYICRYVRKISEPTTTHEDELNVQASWYDIHDALAKLQNDIDSIVKKGLEAFEGDGYQANLRVRQVNLDLIKEALK